MGAATAKPAKAIIITERIYLLTFIKQKKEYRRTPTFVNLKSNTMKNTMQR